MKAAVSKVCGAALCLCFVSILTSVAKAELSVEHQVKSAFLYNFAKFFEWPSAAFRSSSAPLIVCLLGDDQFAAALSAIEGKEANGRTLAVRRLSNASRAGPCHVLFIGASRQRAAGEVLKTLANGSTLTVCESEGCAEAGMMVNLVRSNEKIVLDINLDAVRRSGLKISPQLLKLARIVKDRDGR